MFDDDSLLSISGIQHFVFCRKQWALIHIEQQWTENILTVSGELMHQNAHDSMNTEKRGNILVSRGMPVKSDNRKAYKVKVSKSPSTRRVWIEIFAALSSSGTVPVTLHAEGVDLNDTSKATDISDMLYLFHTRGDGILNYMAENLSQVCRTS